MKRIIGYILITIVSILSFFQLLQTMKIVFGSCVSVVYSWYSLLFHHPSLLQEKWSMAHHFLPWTDPRHCKHIDAQQDALHESVRTRGKHAISGKKQHLHYIGTLLLPHLHLFHLIADASQFRTLFMHFPISYRADIGIPHTLLHPANPP